jgi:hypothetical protein
MTAQEPFNLDAERAVLCAIVKDPNSIESVASMLSPADFNRAHGLFFGRALELFQRGDAVDLFTVIQSLRAHGEIEDAGGDAYLGTLEQLGVSAKNVRAYAQQVKAAADARAADAAIKAAIAAAEENGTDPYAKADNLLFQLQKISRPESEKVAHKFERVSEDRYSLSLPQFGIVLETDRLRREHNELIGELCVRCRLPGARAYDGTLSIADFNLSSARARSERAKLIADRSNAKELDWAGYLEEMCQRVLAAERAGQPAVDLRELERPNADDAIRVEGLSLPRRHPAIIFGDGGAAKSYTGLYLAGRLVEQGLRLSLFDWELAGEDHRDRLERLFGKAMPRILYARCEHPLVYELDRLRRIVRDEKIDYVIYDSVAFACDGPPEAAEVASRYFRAVRQIGVGSLNIAHVSKADDSDGKPFGSTFWHNGARSTWYVKLTDASPDGKTLNVGLFNRKSNLGQLQQPTGFSIEFTADRTYFTKSDPADTPDLAEKMSIQQRMRRLLCHGAMSIEEVADEIEAVPDSVRRTAQRYKGIFTILDGGKVALLQKDSESGQSVRTA